MAIIEIICGDILSLETDALVLPAHKHFIRGQGLSAKLFDQAGPEFTSTCKLLGKSRPGDTRITPAPNLPFQHIIHTVTPQWSSGDFGGTSSLEQLEECYANSADIAIENGIQHIAFPALGTGTNKTPHPIAAHIGLSILDSRKAMFETLVICLHSEFAKNVWLECYETHITHTKPAVAC